MQTSHRRKNPFLPLLLAVTALAVLAVAGWVVLAAAMNPDRLRGELQAAVFRATGRQLTITGGMHLAFGLSPHVVLDGIAFSNVAGGSQPQMITAKSLSAEVALLPLLGGDAVISGLTVQQPDLLLERTADGTPNWIFVPPAKRPLYRGNAAQPSGGPNGGAGNSAHRVQIQTIRLEGGQVTWRPLQGAPVTIGIGQLVVSAQSADSRMTLSFEGTRGNVPIQLTANSGSLARLQGGPVSALAGTWPLTVDLSVQGATVHVEGGINHPDQLRSYQFRVTAHAAALDALNALLPKPYLPPMADVNATALLSDNSEGALQTSQLSVHAGQSDLGRWAPGLLLNQAVFSAPGPGQLMQLSVDGTYQQQPLRLAGTAMQSDVVGGAAPLQVTVSGQAAGATISARGTVPPRLNVAGLDMVLDVKAPDLAPLSALVGRTLPAAQNFTLDAHLVDAGVKLRGVAVQNLAVASSLGDLEGNFTFDWAPRVSLTGALTSRTLNLDGISSGISIPAIWPPATQSGVLPMPPVANAPASGAPAAPVVPPAPVGAPGSAPESGLDLALLRNNDADLGLSVGDLTFAGQHYLNLDAHLQLADGKLALNPFRAQAPEGAIVGGASIDASSDNPPIAVTLRSPSISAAAVARVLGYPDGASGTMQVDAELTGTGQSVPAIEASLDGHVGLAMVNGQVQNSLIEGLIGTALNTAGLSDLDGGASQVRCFATRVNFANGVGSVQALSADMSRLALDGDGQVDLRNGMLNLHLRPQLRLGSANVTAPVSLQGPFGNLKASLDPVLGGGRVGLSFGGGAPVLSQCGDRLALARNGLGGPLPAPAPAATPGFKIRKPKDLLQGLFH